MVLSLFPLLFLAVVKSLLCHFSLLLFLLNSCLSHSLYSFYFLPFYASFTTILFNPASLPVHFLIFSSGLFFYYPSFSFLSLASYFIKLYSFFLSQFFPLRQLLLLSYTIILSLSLFLNVPISFCVSKFFVDLCPFYPPHDIPVPLSSILRLFLVLPSFTTSYFSFHQLFFASPFFILFCPFSCSFFLLTSPFYIYLSFLSPLPTI